MKCIFLAIALMLAADGTQTLTQEERDRADDVEDGEEQDEGGSEGRQVEGEKGAEV